MSPPALPLVYSLFFLWIEPFSTAVGAYYACLRQHDYLELTYPSGMPALAPVSVRDSIVLLQLGNLYFTFAFLEALVLRATSERRVWRVFLLGLLIADFGHLYSVHAIGWSVYYRFWEWSMMYWGNLGFVYVGATMRTAFLLGIDLPNENIAKRRQ